MNVSITKINYIIVIALTMLSMLMISYALNNNFKSKSLSEVLKNCGTGSEVIVKTEIGIGILNSTNMSISCKFIK